MKPRRAISDRRGPRRHGVRLIYSISEDICRLLDEDGCTINTFNPGEEREAVAALICASESHEAEDDEDDTANTAISAPSADHGAVGRLVRKARGI